MRGQDGIGAVVLPDFSQKTLPILKSERPGKDVQRAGPRLVGAIDITPQPLECGGAEGFMGAVPNDAAEKDEIIGRLHLASDLLFQAFPEFVDFGSGFRHVCQKRFIEAFKVTFLSRKQLIQIGPFPDACKKSGIFASGNSFHEGR